MDEMRWKDQMTLHRSAAVECESDAPMQERTLRLIVLGAQNVGKSQIVSRLIGRPFADAYMPTIEDFHQMKYVIDGHIYRLDILDTSGQNISPVIRNLTLLTGDIFLVVYSVARRETWNEAKDIITAIDDTVGNPIGTYSSMARNFKKMIARGTDIGFVRHGKPKNHAMESSEHHGFNYPHIHLPLPVFVIGNKGDAANAEIQPEEVETWLRELQSKQTLTVEHHISSANKDCIMRLLFDDIFSTCRLPIELSSYRHDKVAAKEYSAIVSPIINRVSSNRHSLRMGPQIFGALKGRNQQSNNHRDRSMNEIHGESSSVHAIATLRSNQRRPCLDAEIILAVMKMRQYAEDANVKWNKQLSKTKSLKTRVERLGKRISN